MCVCVCTCADTLLGVRVRVYTLVSTTWGHMDNLQNQVASQWDLLSQESVKNV